MKLLFATRSLDGNIGGSARRMTSIINTMIARDHETQLLTWDHEDAETFYPLSPDVVWNRIECKSRDREAKSMRRLRCRKIVRNLISNWRPQVIVSFSTANFLPTYLYSFGSEIPLVSGDTMGPTSFKLAYASGFVNRLNVRRKNFVSMASLHLAARIVVQRESLRSQYSIFLRDRIAVIPNAAYPALHVAEVTLPDDQGRFRVLGKV